MFAASLGALLAHSIDYAGMFPPCSLELEPALRNQAGYVRDRDAWMLGAFVLPIGKFDAAVGSISLFDRKHPLLISALGAKTANAGEFIDALKIAADKIRSFSAQPADLVSIRQLEMPLPQDVDLGLLAKIRSTIEALKLQAFWEAPGNSAEKTIALLAEHNSKIGAPESGGLIWPRGRRTSAPLGTIELARP